MKLLYIFMSIIISMYVSLSACPTCVSNTNTEPFFSDEYYMPHEQQSLKTDKPQSQHVMSSDKTTKPCCQNKKKEASHE